MKESKTIKGYNFWYCNCFRGLTEWRKIPFKVEIFQGWRLEKGLCAVITILFLIIINIYLFTVKTIELQKPLTDGITYND